MSLRALVPAALLWALTTGAASQVLAATEAAGPPAAPNEVRGWLLRIHEAASRRNFQGTFVVSGGGSVASARIAHYHEGPNQYERIEALDGRQRRVYRHNEIVHTLWPASQVALIEQRGLLNSFPALLQAGDSGVASLYDVRAEGVERMAGREADVLAVSARDGFRHGYRLWADRASGLLLRADVIGERGQVLETSAFSDVEIGIRPQPESVLQAMRKLDGYQVVRPVMSPTRLEDEGWRMRQIAPGFRQVSCISRRIEAPSEAAADPSAPPVIQAIYSDGLTYVSLFIEPYRPQRHSQSMLAAVGATMTLTRRLGDWWVTVVGDTPAATLKYFASGLERSRP